MYLLDLENIFNLNLFETNVLSVLIFKLSVYNFSLKTFNNIISPLIKMSDLRIKKVYGLEAGYKKFIEDKSKIVRYYQSFLNKITRELLFQRICIYNERVAGTMDFIKFYM